MPISERGGGGGGLHLPSNGIRLSSSFHRNENGDGSQYLILTLHELRLLLLILYPIILLTRVRGINTSEFRVPSWGCAANGLCLSGLLVEIEIPRSGSRSRSRCWLILIVRWIKQNPLSLPTPTPTRHIHLLLWLLLLWLLLLRLLLLRPQAIPLLGADRDEEAEHRYRDPGIENRVHDFDILRDQDKEVGVDVIADSDGEFPGRADEVEKGSGEEPVGQLGGYNMSKQEGFDGLNLEKRREGDR